jgi:hypothetical protein
MKMFVFRFYSSISSILLLLVYLGSLKTADAATQVVEVKFQMTCSTMSGQCVTQTNTLISTTLSFQVSSSICKAPPSPSLYLEFPSGLFMHDQLSNVRITVESGGGNSCDLCNIGCSGSGSGSGVGSGLQQPNRRSLLQTRTRESSVAILSWAPTTLTVQFDSVLNELLPILTLDRVTVELIEMKTGDASAGGDIHYSTSTDTVRSETMASGVIGGQVTSPSFAIATSDRVAGQPGAAATFSFTTTAGGKLATGGTITLTYPSGFFSSTGTPVVQISGDGPPTGKVATPTSTQIVITIETLSVAASSAVTVTLKGLTMGAANAGTTAGITVTTSVDRTASSDVSSGAIGDVVQNPSFSMDSADRVVARVTASAKLMFQTSAGGGLTYSSADALNAKITLIYPTGFFDTSTTPSPVISGTELSGVTASCAHSGSTKLVVSLTAGAIPAASNLVTIAALL